MKNADKFVVGGLVYDVLSPATFGDYMETIGSACINPDGYAENKLFLAYDDNVQKLFRATTAIANSELLIKDTNCEPTTMAEALANALSAGGVSYDNTDSGLTASNVQGAIDEVNGNVETVNNELSNVEDNLSHRNLLDNPWFTVNQRGQSSYTGNSIYTFDRWWMWGDRNQGASIQIVNGIVTLSQLTGLDYSIIQQKLEDDSELIGKTITMSIMLADGTIKSGSGVYNPTIDNNVYGDPTLTLGWDSTHNFRIGAIGEPLQFKAVKLELGSVSTLAMDTAPNYAEELAKCQRYFFKTDVKSYNESTAFISRAASPNYLTGVTFPTTMRTDPSFSQVKAYPFLGGTIIDSGFYMESTKDGVRTFANTGAFTEGMSYYVQFEASADL